MIKKSSIFETFVSYRTQLEKAVKGIVPSDDVDDIIQETFVKSYEAELKQEISYQRTYMLRTARNLALNHVSKASAKGHDSLDDSEALPQALCSKQLEKQVESKERFLNFCRATDSLSTEVKRVFLLKKVYGLSQKEIAERLQLSESTVEKHVAKGLKQCAEYLQRLNQLQQLGEPSVSSLQSRRAGQR